MRTIYPDRYGRIEISEINRLAEQSVEQLVDRAEDFYQVQLEDAAEQILNHSNARIVLLSGPSASGKTTTAYKIRDEIIARGCGAIVVSMDDFFRNRNEYPLLPDGTEDFESVGCLDLPTIHRCLEELLEYGFSEFPLYDFVSGRRKKDAHTVNIGENDIVIMEGIHAINPAVTGDIDNRDTFKIYISVRSKFILGDREVLQPKDIRLMRRMIRDNNFRNYRPSDTLLKWQSVLDGEKRNLDPFRDQVNLKFDSTLDYEPCIYRHYLTPFMEHEDRTGQFLSLIHIYIRVWRIF